jgi:hypothetical protein
MLSIAGLKCEATDNGPKELQNYTDLANIIIEQIGREKFIEIIKSNEYISLYEKNRFIFEMVDWVKKNCKKDDPAYLIDEANYGRFICKNQIQEKFFGGKTKETKHGY